MCSTTDRSRLGCAIASIPRHSNSTKIEFTTAKKETLRRGRSVSFPVSKQSKRLRSRTGASHEFGNGIPVPHAEQQDLRACRIFEYVKNCRLPLDFKEAWTPRIRPRRSASAQQQTQFCNLLRRMISQVFHERRFFGHGDHFSVPPHSAYRCPHKLRRIKFQNVSWTATFSQASSRQFGRMVSVLAYGSLMPDERHMSRVDSLQRASNSSSSVQR